MAMPFRSVFEMSQVQRQDIERLWLTQTRQLVDVQPNSGEPPPIMNDNSARFVGRLFAFFEAFFQYNNEVDRNENQENYLDQGTFIKRGPNSCLHNLLYLVFDDKNAIKTSHETTRLVCNVHHGEFLDELQEFEIQGQQLTDEYRKESFGAYLHHFPNQALYSVGTAVGLAVVGMVRKTNSQTEVEPFLENMQWIFRFHHVTPRNHMMDIKTGLAYKFLSVKGHVVKARPKRLRVSSAEFSCSKCRAVLTHVFSNGKYSCPTKCTTPNCRSRSFSLMRPSARYINVQEMRLQEAQEESTLHAGRTPRQLEVILEHDLVDQCRPGDIVIVSGIVQAINSALAAGRMGRRAQETSTYKLYLQAHSITTMSERRRDQGNGNHQAYHNNNNTLQQQHQQAQAQQQQVVYTQQQLQAIAQLCHADHRFFGMVERRAFPFDLLVRSLCPSIIGHDVVKAGILLCLLGGTPPTAVERGNQIRCNSHILIVGDPGMGKSQLLLAATQVAPRSVYVGGNTASTTGLTVSMTKEPGGEAGIEAGALVLADQGVCCIDEFDKMAKSHQDGLLEAMEQQQISIAKAGVVASLPARCSVIAAANPKHGSYTLSKTVAENLNMATPILSRFDLVFILRDRANSDQDRKVASKIMNLHRNRSEIKQGDGASLSMPQKSLADRLPLKDRLEWVAQFQQQPLPADLVRDYISYAREYCKPKLTPEAAEVLKEYFMNLRYPTDGRSRQDTVPITTRQLEALIRLSQARAKACLREYVLREDALDVVELMTCSVEDVHKDESGNIDRSRGGAGGKSKRKVKKAFVNEAFRLVGAGGECTEEDLRRIAVKVNCELYDFKDMIEDIRNEGTLIKLSSGNYRVVS